MRTTMILCAWAKQLVPANTIVNANEFLNLLKEEAKRTDKELNKDTEAYIIELGGSYGGEGAKYGWSSNTI